MLKLHNPAFLLLVVGIFILLNFVYVYFVLEVQPLTTYSGCSLVGGHAYQVDLMDGCVQWFHSIADHRYLIGGWQVE